MSWNTLEDALALGYGIERQFKCHVHQENNASASINAVSGLWVCYGCGAKGKVDPENVRIAPQAVENHVRRALRVLEDDGRIFYPESWLSIYDSSGPGEYWLSRFDPATCKRFRLGFDPVSQASVYPLRDPAGRVLGVVQRTWGDGPKYKYPLGSDTSSLLFNYHACTDDTLVFTEGATDAIAVEECGVQAMALYGSRVSRAQQVLINRYSPKHIWLATDQDASGERAWLAMRQWFPHLDVRRMRWDGFKDLAAMPKDHRTSVLTAHGLTRVESPSCGSSGSNHSLSSPPSSATRRRVVIRRKPPTG